MTNRFDAGRRARALVLAGSLPLGAALLAAAVVVGCPGPDPKEAATGGGGASSSGMEASTSTGGTTRTGGGGDTMSSGMGGGGKDGGMGGGGGCMINGMPGRDCNGTCVDVLGDPNNCGACDRQCSNQNVDQSVDLTCHQGRCRSKCLPGWVDDTASDPQGSDNGCETPARRVFVTSMAMAGVFGGANLSADQVCRNAAPSPATSTVWRAWLSTSMQSSPLTLFDMTYQGDYVLMDGTTIVARTWQGLIDAVAVPLLNAIDHDEAGAPITVSPLEVWTGTNPDGSSTGNDCNAWSATGATSMATIGLTTAKNGAWTGNFNAAHCNAVRRLYCFEDMQGP